MHIFGSPRRFTVMGYQHSHGLLLLSSFRSKIDTTCVDVLVQDVRALEMRFWFEGIAISEADISYLEGFGSRPEDLIEPGNRIYALEGTGWHGFIVGGRFSSTEYEGEWEGGGRLLGDSAPLRRLSPPLDGRSF